MVFPSDHPTDSEENLKQDAAANLCKGRLWCIEGISMPAVDSHAYTSIFLQIRTDTYQYILKYVHTSPFYPILYVPIRLKYILICTNTYHCTDH